MRAEFERVLELQPDYTPQNSPAMQERGLLVRTASANWLRARASELSAEAQLDPADFLVEGRDGTGLKNRVPWVRFGSRTRSESATQGFYVVYLFAADGDAVYLSINQGTTAFVRGEFVAKPAHEIAANVAWAREVLNDWLAVRDDLAAITLSDRGLGAGYERGNIVAVEYRRGAVPDDATLLSDARAYATALGRLYATHAARPLPNELPEVEAAIAAADAAAGKRARSNPGYRVTAAEIKLIEMRAVGLARTYYESQGWTVKELGKPFDLELRRDDELITVEVKGTTSDGSGVPLTDGEVRHHAAAYPNNALVVVRNIILDRSTTPATVSGGTLHELRGWSIDPDHLRPISYTYTVPASLYETNPSALYAQTIS